jgi:AAA15 family ATPase/GTPase
MKFIETIEIKNFKSIRHQKIEGCKRINVFIGYPNVGKSNLLEALGIFSSLRLSEDFFRFNDLCRVKNFSELFYNKNYRNAINITLNNRLMAELILTQSNELAIRVHTMVNAGSQIENTIFSAEVDTRNFNYRYANPANEIDYSDILGPIRKYEFAQNEILTQQRPLALAIPSGANLLDILQRDSALRKEIAEIFEDYRLKLLLDGDEIKFLKYLSDDTGIGIPYHQIADTLRRLIFYKAAIISNTESTLLFEEPEAHMFPQYISRFASSIINDENRNQYFITTHSAFVLNDFMEDLEKSDLAIFAVGFNKEGETIVRKFSDAEIDNIYQYGVDLFFNLENYLKNETA